MENGYSGVFLAWYNLEEVSDGHGGLLLQVGGGKAISSYYRASNYAVFVAKYYVGLISFDG